MVYYTTYVVYYTTNVYSPEIPILNKQGQQEGYKKCLKKCVTCSVINLNKVFRNRQTGMSYSVPNVKVSCNSRNVIYLISCTNCELQYVGKCETQLKRRHHKHRTQIRNNKEGVGRHFSSCGGMDALRLQVIDVAARNDLRKRENHWIQELQTLTPDGFNLRKESKG